MRKLIVSIFFFGLGFLILVCLFGRYDNIDRDRSINPNVVRIQQAHLLDSLDILFVGSSASYSGINPVYFDSVGLRTYNLGLAAAGPYFYELLLDDYLSSVRQKPKTVFFLIMPSTFMSRIDQFEEIGIHRYLFMAVSNEALVRKFNLWGIYPSLLMKSFQKGVRNLIHIDKADNQVLQHAFKNKGFYPSDEMSSAEKEKAEALSYSGWKKDSFPVAKFEYLLSYATSLQNRGIKVVFFSLPGNRASSFFSDEYIHQYRKKISQLQTRFSLYDLSALSLDSTCFRNSDHLNSKGAEKVSKELIGRIKKTDSTIAGSIQKRIIEQ